MSTPSTAPAMGAMRTRAVLLSKEQTHDGLAAALVGAGLELQQCALAAATPALLEWAELVVTPLDRASVDLLVALPEPPPLVVGLHGAPDARVFDQALAVGALAVLDPMGDSEAVADVVMRVGARVPALRRARLIHSTLSGQDRQVVVVVDQLDRMLLVSDALVRTSGRPRGTLVGEDVDLVLPQMLGAQDDSHNVLRADGSSAAVNGRWFGLGDQRVFVGQLEGGGGDVGAHGAFIQNRLKMAMIESAHDINNKVTVVSFLLSNLVEDLTRLDPQNPEVGQMNQDLNDSLGQILRLNEILRLYGHTTVSKGSEQLDLREIARVAVQHVALERPMAAHMAVPEGPPALIFGPRNRMLQVVANLVRNAQDAVEQDVAGVVRMELQCTDQWVRLVVEDSGPGLPFDNPREAIRPWTSGSRDPGRLGLGLFVADKVVIECEGRLTFGRSPLGGLAVTVELPRAS